MHKCFSIITVGRSVCGVEYVMVCLGVYTLCVCVCMGVNVVAGVCWDVFGEKMRLRQEREKEKGEGEGEGEGDCVLLDC